MAAIDDWPDIPVLARLPEAEADQKLRELADGGDLAHEGPVPKQGAFASKSIWPFRDRPWRNVEHAFGFVTDSAFEDGYAIANAGDPKQVVPDESLRGARIKITLDTLYAEEYPGGGEHQILFDFYAKHQTVQSTEPLHFNASLKVRNGQFAGIIGQPLFDGLTVGPDGVDFRCRTINVANTEDEKLLGFLDSDTFRGGLKLLTIAQPATALFSETAIALTRHLAQRHRNVAVQEFRLGLDFSGQVARAALRAGSYIAIQAGSSEKPFRWDEWYFHSDGKVVSRAGRQRAPYNYVLFTVTRSRGEGPVDSPRA